MTLFKAPFSHEAAIRMNYEGRGTHFDATVLDAFVAVAEDFQEIARCYADG